MREPQGESRFYNGIWHVKLDGLERKIVHDMVLAFFWSPNGREIAYVTTSEGAEGSVRWAWSTWNPATYATCPTFGQPRSS